MRPRYVNMADLSLGEPIDQAALTELLFCAYRDFTSDPDALLARYGFGRAHHRVLHFVDRNPGLTVADLLDILKITKQSLGRVLKSLVDLGFIEQTPGAADRRQRLLSTTPKGRALAAQLAEPQARRIAQALAALPPGGGETVARFLVAMIDEGERAKATRLVAEGGRAA